jgi:hypothetical protein
MRSFGLLIGLAALVACGSTKSNDPAPGSYGTTLAPTKQPPPNPVGSFSAVLPAVTLQPGEEKTPCYLFDLAPAGPSRTVGGGHIKVGPGMHHGNITTRPKTGTGTRECPAETATTFGGEGIDIVNGGAVLFASSTQLVGEEWQSFPPGYGFPIKDGFGHDLGQDAPDADLAGDGGGGDAVVARHHHHLDAPGLQRGHRTGRAGLDGVGHTHYGGG